MNLSVLAGLVKSQEIDCACVHSTHTIAQMCKHIVSTQLIIEFCQQLSQVAWSGFVCMRMEVLNGSRIFHGRPVMLLCVALHKRCIDVRSSIVEYSGVDRI